MSDCHGESMTADIIKFKPKYELDCEKAVESVLNAADDLKVLLCKPVDTAPSEYSAPSDGDCA